MLATLFRRDRSIRAVGLTALAAGLLAVRVLFTGAVTPMGPAGFAAAACAFLGCSVGAALTCLGAHIHDRITIARPWASARTEPRGRS